MLFNSIQYLVFLPFVILVYFLVPKKLKTIWLLACSYFFYMCWKPSYIILILASTVMTYLCGLSIDTFGRNHKKLILFLGLTFNLGMLVYFKYVNFFLDVGSKLFRLSSVPKVDILLPVGISFFTFQGLGYVIDVYRGTIPAEKSFLQYALFVSFFPQLVAGPIERSGNLLHQLRVPHKFSFDNFRNGCLLILWGLFQKIVVADRIAIFVDRIYGEPDVFPGWYLIIATVLFAIQIYCDFGGYTTIAIGSAKILGIQLMDNFDAPYLSLSVASFWRRWHISLTSWFRDYLYFPLGGSRKGPLRKHLNRMIVFLVSGLWHGANYTFVLWGALNGLYQILGDLLKGSRDGLVRVLGLHRESFGHRLLSGVVTFILIDFSWIFFRAQSFSEAITIIKSIFTVSNHWVLFDGSLFQCGLDEGNFLVMIISIGILFFADYMRRKEINLRTVILRQDYWFRWILFSLSVVLLVIFGIWGNQYDANSFIYFQF